MKLENKRILVTGGATGIGCAICQRLVREGATVYVNYRTREEEALQLKREFGDSVYLVRADVREPDQVRDMLQEIDRLDSVVHAACAPLFDGEIFGLSWDTFVNQWEVAVRGAFLLVGGCLDKGLESAVFLLSSVTIGVPPAEKSAYVSAKYALYGLAKSMAVELAPIRVNCVSPSFTDTPLTSHVDPRVKKLIARASPFRRLCSPEDVAGAVSFLISDDSSYVTGINLPVCGGVQM